MSEDVDLVRSIYPDWERGDYLSRADWIHTEIEFVWADGPDPGSWIGPEEMAKAWSDQLRLYHEYRAIAEEFRELDHERVLVLTRTSGRGKISSVESGALSGKSATLFCPATQDFLGAKSGRSSLRRRQSPTACRASFRRSGDPRRNAGPWHQMLALSRQSRVIAHRQVAAAQASNALAFVATVRAIESVDMNLGRLAITAGFEERSPCGHVF